MGRQIACAWTAGIALLATGCGDDDGSDDGEQVDAGSSPWEVLDDIPIGPIQETAVVTLDGILYILGGIDDDLDTRGTVLTYDVAGRTWGFGPALPFLVHHVNAAVVDRTIYLTGALTEGFDPIGNVLSWTPGDESWAEHTPMTPGTERGASAVGVVDGRIVVAGGLGVINSVATVGIYDPATDAWDDDVPVLPVPLDHATGQSVDGVFYVIGGRTNGLAGNRAGVYAFVDGAWQMRSPMPIARGGIGSGVVDGKIIVVGGEGNPATASGVFPQTQRYDPATDQWTSLADMRTPRHGMGAAGVGDRLYVPGGADTEGFGAVAVHEALPITAGDAP